MELWDRYKRGESKVFTRRLYTLQGQQTFDEIRRKYAPRRRVQTDRRPLCGRIRAASCGSLPRRPGLDADQDLPDVRNRQGLHHAGPRERQAGLRRPTNHRTEKLPRPSPDADLCLVTTTKRVILAVMPGLDPGTSKACEMGAVSGSSPALATCIQLGEGSALPAGAADCRYPPHDVEHHDRQGMIQRAGPRSRHPPRLPERGPGKCAH